MNLEKHVAFLRSLVLTELAYARAEEAALLSALTPSALQARGLAILNLRQANVRSGLGGRVIVELVSRVGGKSSSFSAHTIKVGDIVRIEEGAPAGDAASVSGVVYKVKEDAIEVALRDDIHEDVKPFDWVRIVKMANEVAYERQLEALRLLASERMTDVVELAFEKRDLPLLSSGHPALAVDFYNEGLNKAQKRAIKDCMQAKHLALIHGPPGTGKTATLVELIRQMKRKLLVCGPSNLSVDNIIERLATSGLKLTRLGHPARILETVLPFSLDYQLEAEGEVIRDIRKEIQQALKDMPTSRERRRLYQELKANRKELREREEKLMLEILRNADVVLCTLNMAASRALKGFLKKESIRFDAVIIDEGSQSVEPEAWIAARLANKLVIAGDHKQLPPTIGSPDAAELGKTLFERLIGMYPNACNLLDTQYRMHSVIMNWANAAMYDSKLKADGSVADHLLKDLPGVQDRELTRTVLVFIDTAGSDMLESIEEGDPLEADSKSNEGEAKLAAKHLHELIDAGLKPSQCAIITPYNAQVALIKSLLSDIKVEVGSGKISAPLFSQSTAFRAVKRRPSSCRLSDPTITAR